MNMNIQCNQRRYTEEILVVILVDRYSIYTGCVYRIDTVEQGYLECQSSGIKSVFNAHFVKVRVPCVVK